MRLAIERRIVTQVAHPLFDDMSAMSPLRRLAARAYEVTHPFRRRVLPGIATRRSASRGIDANADDEVKVGVDTGTLTPRITGHARDTESNSGKH